ncbi:ATP-dependent RNA helicase dhx37 [Aphanomyces cochlioides]|nr:ATP-dependent RNA helicase dhx37 [Aphanomyces cochlioides]
MMVGWCRISTNENEECQTKIIKLNMEETKQDDAPGLLSKELMEELGGDEAELISVRKKKAKGAPKIAAEVVAEATKLSKSKRKKLAQLEERKRKEARRDQVLQSLEAQKLPEEHLNLMYSTAKLGHKETLKERLKRSINLEKAGLTLSENARQELYPELRQAKPSEPSQEEPEEIMEVDEPETQEPSLSGTTTEATDDAAKAKKKKKKAVFSTPHNAESTPAATTETEAPETSAVQAETRSESAMMAKLLALRAKNEAKRKLKEQGGPQAPAAQPDVYENRPKYTPATVELPTTEDMLVTSKQVAPLVTKRRVHVNRKDDIQLARMQLPVCSSEQEIMEAIENHSVVILCGETGSGKTTQVPQFLYEAGYGTERPGMIGVTQPRRVAAVSTAQRVATELNVDFGKTGAVGYQIRYDNEHVGEKTIVKFMTDGILLKEIQQDFLLKKYSIILLDEAHERNVNTDILIGLLSRVAPFRAQMALEEKEQYDSLSEAERATTPPPIAPLKLVIMSATLRVEDFTENKTLFPSPPPVIKVEARQYPVTVHFNKHTELNDYVSAAYQKVVKIHRKLPEGAILVFLTGQREIMQLVRQLNRTLGSKRRQVKSKPTNTRNRVQDEEWYIREHDDDDDQADADEADLYGDEADGSDNNEQSEENDPEEEDPATDLPYVHVLPLYSMLSNDLQMKVFDAPPEKHRLVVVATNVAETSLTIPGVRYVVDAGRTKERVYDLKSGISQFEIQWISKASADQRAGRAGRTGPGHCYRLYSSAVFDNEFKKFSPPQILCQPIEDVVLQMKAMGIENVLQFPFPTPPEALALNTAVTTLLHLGALSAKSNMITAGFPVAPRFAKMLLLANQLGCLEYTIALVAALSGQSPFILERERKEAKANKEDEDEEIQESDWTAEMKEAEAMRRHIQWMNEDSDVLSMLRAAGAYAYSGGSSAFCTENHLHEKIMEQMLKLRGQLTTIVNKLLGQELVLRPNMPPPSDDEQDLLRQIIAAGFLDQVARRVPPGTITSGSKIERNCAYLSCNGTVTEPLYIHPHSHLFTPDPSRLPQYVVYNNVVRTSRAYMKTVTAIEPEWLFSVAANSPLCETSEPMQAPPPKYNASLDRVECFVKPMYGNHKWELPAAQVEFPAGQVKMRWFGRFLLDGAVVPSLKPFLVGKLREPSMSLIKKKFDAKIQLLVSTLARHNVASRKALVAQWQSNPRFLLDEILNWVQDNHKASLKQQWKTLVAKEVQAS